MNFQKKIFTLLIVTITISLLFAPAALAQEDPDGFTEDFDSGDLEGWEHSQDVVVENGVLKLSPGSMALHPGDWSDIDLTVRLRFTPPGEVVINYLMGEGGHYALILIGERAILDKISGEEPTNLADAEVTNFNSQDWNDVNIKVEGGNHTITINQSVVITVTDSDPFSAGALMLHALSGATLEVDSVSLSGTPMEGMPPEGEQPGGEGIPPEGEGQPEGGGEPVPGSTEGGSEAAPQTGGTTSEPQSLLDEFMSGQSNQLELSTFLINLLLAVICAFILGRVYVYWGTSLSNRRAFASNFMLLTVTTTFIILVVRSSVALSLGLVGALSIVRFRAAVKEPEELAYLFFAISLGIGLGDNQRLITLLTLVVGIAVVGLLRLFRTAGADVNLHLTISSQNPGKVDLDQVTAVLEKHCSKIKLLRFDETPEVLESSYVIEFKRVSDLSAAKADLQALSPAMQISFLDNKGIW
jgi:hypothetical protein